MTSVSRSAIRAFRVCNPIRLLCSSHYERGVVKCTFGRVPQRHESVEREESLMEQMEMEQMARGYDEQQPITPRTHKRHRISQHSRHQLLIDDP